MGNKIEQISQDLKQIAATVEQWSVKRVSEIERDIVLERVRAIYQVIKFELGEQDECCSVATPEMDGGLSVDPSEMDCRSGCDVVALEHELGGDLPAEEKGQSVLQAESIDPNKATPSPVESGEPVRIKLDRETLLSLYHSGDYSPDVAAKSIKERDTAATPPPEVDVPSDIFDDLPHSDHRTVADVEPRQTLGDVYARNHTADVGEEISKSSITELRKSIGINDRFQIIKEVFNGDEDIYDGVIDELESFTNLDEALLHIHENYNWNPNSEGVNRLIELLTKKLS